MSARDTKTLPASHGVAITLNKGQMLKVINTYGKQAIDTWAFNAADVYEFMSMEHTRAGLEKIIPDPGDPLLTNKRRPILTLVEDESPGIHDMLVPACDRYRYEELGFKGYHRSCADNFREVAEEFGFDLPIVPSPFNLFTNRPVVDGRRLERLAPVSKAGDFVVLRAEMNCIIALSSCPQDIVATNGQDCTPRDTEYKILDGDVPFAVER